MAWLTHGLRAVAVLVVLAGYPVDVAAAPPVDGTPAAGLADVAPSQPVPVAPAQAAQTPIAAAAAPAGTYPKTAPPAAKVGESAKPGDMTMAGFLDRLMAAESGGRDDARNPRSTAVGPYQFIESTWLDLARRIFANETQAMTPQQILALRMDRSFARRGAEAYTKDNAAILKANGLDPTFPHLRLAFLLGPQGAVRVLQAPPQTRVTFLLGPAVAQANPFMFGLTAEGLVARAARDLAVPASTLAGIAPGDIPAPGKGGAARAQRPKVVVQCNLALPACRRWQTLALARLAPAKSGKKVVDARQR